MASFPERVALKAADVAVAKILLTILALPFYVLGFIAGVLWVAVRWIFAAVVVGFGDVTTRRAVTGDAG
jgi:hypothetical protein